MCVSELIVISSGLATSLTTFDPIVDLDFPIHPTTHDGMSVIREATPDGLGVLYA
jgi:hypothetical protein